MHLRSELMEVSDEGSDSELQFLVDDIEIELDIVTTSTVEGSSKLDYWIFNAELAGEMGNEARQKLTLRLKPLTSNGSLKLTRRGSR